jgi:hypothetical protein
MRLSSTHAPNALAQTWSRIARALARLNSSLSAIMRHGIGGETDIASRYEGCRWCDSIERKLNAALTERQSFDPFGQRDR